MPRNTYSDEFKADAVRLYETTEGASYSSISEDLGIARGTLKTWVRKARGTEGRFPLTSTRRLPWLGVLTGDVDRVDVPVS